jgi:hypothetical protein
MKVKKFKAKIVKKSDLECESLYKVKGLEFLPTLCTY